MGKLHWKMSQISVSDKNPTCHPSHRVRRSSTYPHYLAIGALAPDWPARLTRPALRSFRPRPPNSKVGENRLRHPPYVPRDSGRRAWKTRSMGTGLILDSLSFLRSLRGRERAQLWPVDVSPFPLRARAPIWQLVLIPKWYKTIDNNAVVFQRREVCAWRKQRSIGWKCSIF